MSLNTTVSSNTILSVRFFCAYNLVETFSSQFFLFKVDCYSFMLLLQEQKRRNTGLSLAGDDNDGMEIEVT